MSESSSPHAQLHAAILDLFYDTVSRYPPRHAPGREPAGDPPHRLGDYLVYQGYLSARELDSAIQDAQGANGAKPVPLGFALVRRYNVPAPVLAITLLMQTLDRLEQTPNLPPQFLGEQLLREASISPEQLAVVLEEQASNYGHGGWSRIGDLIANHGWLDAEALTQAVQSMRQG
ncbi:hypothetical protein K2Z83_16925 [Oscillochloris sp. ZM17-4]|uniref:hypothetical protein n=1 Tax=Oscillochloris sp. ZM17-4 TaxID=2866714 RepID=UPI001C72E48C|nr:hypothetical protein [Oscillochloris sp. ZM17-4]MBX0329357.1 hypothetical protein [Oscillochloris sp. ZM17-4]